MMDKNNTSFESCLLEQLSKHPAIKAQDLVKLSYQAAYGAEHLLSDVDAARAYFMAEFENTEAAAGELFEPISADFARVNIAQWKQSGLKAHWLFELFRQSVAQREGGRQRLIDNLKAAEKNLSHSSVSIDEWDTYIKDYVNQGMPAVHHSEAYRTAEHPAYRLVRRPLLRLVPVLELVSRQQERPYVIAIDGRAGSGKSSLAVALSALLDADIVHMDDFFLPLELRTAQRLFAPGGNVHYERFRAEVLPMLHCGEDFSYNVFSCSQMKLNGSREVKAGEFIIVEGSYSLHPEFGDYADISVFSTVDPEEQLRRIRLRDGEQAAKMFASRWIPMEENYFSAFDIPAKCDVIV